MYVGQIPAQAFDKVNENFFRTTFYELCTRYLAPDFMFAIEVNHPSGQSDWEAGRPRHGSRMKRCCWSSSTCPVSKANAAV